MHSAFIPLIPTGFFVVDFCNHFIYNVIIVKRRKKVIYNGRKKEFNDICGT